MTRHCLAIIVVLSVCAKGVVAQSPTAIQASDGQGVPTLTAVSPQTIELKSIVTVTASGLGRWCDANSADAKALVLYLDGHEVLTVPDQQRCSDTMKLRLTRDAANRNAWAGLLGKPTLTHRPTVIQMGVRGKAPFAGGQQVNLDVLDGSYLFMAGTALLLLLVVTIVLARRSDLLREGPMEVAAAERRPFSLGRTQMMAWFFVVLSSFIFIWIVTGAYDPLTGSVLGLIGISAGTAMGAMVIDANKEAAVANQDGALRAERLRLEAELEGDKVKRNDAQAMKAALAATADATDIDRRITDLNAAISTKTARLTQLADESQAVGRRVHPSTSKGFWSDLVSDQNGVSFHRFQIVVWTLVLIVIFVRAVFENLAMPDFDEKLLALMGLTSGTYLGFKFPEAK